MKLDVKQLLILLRPKQWIKNLVIFAALIFSRNLFYPPLMRKTFVAFVALCALSSAGYILNDLLDIKEDRAHPWKRTRPLASRAVKVPTTIVLSFLLCLFSLVVGYALGLNLFFVLIGYLVLQLGYSLGLKHVVLVDVILIACGFVLRAVAGAVVIDVAITSWLLLCTFFLALFLALCKRRQEINLLKEEAAGHRPVLTEYSEKFIDALIPIVTGSTVLCYALYTVSDEVVIKFGTDRLVFTFPFVLYGIFRYLYLLHMRQLGDSPTKVLYTDRPLQLDILAWLLACLALVYGGNF